MFSSENNIVKAWKEQRCLPLFHLDLGKLVIIFLYET